MKFSRSTYRVTEDGGSVQPALVLSRPVSANTTVTVLSSDGSAEGSYYICITYVRAYAYFEYNNFMHDMLLL